MDDGTEQPMMEGDTGDQWTSAVSALFIRIRLRGRITLPLGGGRLCCAPTKKPHSDTTLFSLLFFFFLLNQSAPDGTSPLSVWIYLTYPPAKNPRESVGKIVLSHSSRAGMIC